MNWPCLILALSAATINCQTAPRLARFDVDPTRITLSGFSAGGTFAQMLQFSYSSRFAGIAVFSHTFYRCGPSTGKLDDYDRLCTKLSDLKENEYYNPELVHTDILAYHQQKLIEDPNQLKNKRLYVYTGLRNFLFTPAQSLGILNIYERYIRCPECIRTRAQDANLVLPTNNPNITAPCTDITPESAFVGSCGFSGAYDALNFLLPEQVRKEPTVGRHVHLQPLQTFDQSEFYRLINKHHMDSTGFLYVPTNCRSGSRSRCLLHFYFHGCLTGREFNETRHIQNSGFLEVAEMNNIIMVFPQAASSLPENEIGCFDTFGISSPLYATREGAQVRVVKGILDRILDSGAPYQVPPVIQTDRQSSLSSSSAGAQSSYNWRNSHKSHIKY